MKFYRRTLRSEKQPQKIVKFPHRTRPQTEIQSAINFPHKSRPVPEVTMPPRVSVRRHRLSVRRFRPPPPLILKFKPRPVPTPKAPVTPPTPPNPLIHRKKNVELCDGLVSIIILNYNTLEVLKPCIQSILENTVHPYELILVDNGSTDGSVAWIKEHKDIHIFIENRWNHGWAKANNRGIKVAHGDYILLLNSDVIVRNYGWLCKMVACFEDDPMIGTVGAKLLYENGTIQHIGGGIHGGGDPYHPFDHSPANIPEAKVNHVVPFVTGACLLINRKTMRKVGLFDEGFYFGFDDVDYGLRVLMAGLKNVVCCETSLTHLWAYTQRKFKVTSLPSLNKYREKWTVDRLKALRKKTEAWDWGIWAPWAPLSSVPLTVPKV